MKNFKQHLYYFPENEVKLQEDLKALRASGHTCALRVTGEVDNSKLTVELQNDDDDASWDN